ncbi:MAG: UDP-3-O-acyl-N-acetylglucosamine deacetylase, partial [Planctomycetes bacterium]|nr:UDP-3-O-acyl-N-acetylglucosamine deacetylase [Planctomycetota bacterium]
MMHHRPQQTLQRPATLSGIGFLTGADVRIRFLPAKENSGIAFQRLDLPDSPPVAARLENVISGQRRTVIASRGVTVMMIEHVMAALAGLQIDNCCLVQVDAAEPPGFDGSAQPIVEALLQAGITCQTAPRKLLRISEPARVDGLNGQASIVARPGPQPASLVPTSPTFQITYALDYGPDSLVPPQKATFVITPETFQ